MIMSDNFPNVMGAKNDPSYSSDNFAPISPNPSDSSLLMENSSPLIQDPNDTTYLGATKQGPWVGGQTPDFNGGYKKKTDMSGMSGMANVQYGSNDKGIGTGKYDPTAGSSGFNINGQVSITTYGDPANTAVDKKDGFGPQSEG